MKTLIALSCAALTLAGCVTSDQIETPASRAEGAFQFSEANTAIPEAPPGSGSHAVAGSAGLYKPREIRPTQMIMPDASGMVASGASAAEYGGRQSFGISGPVSGPTFHSTTKRDHLRCAFNGGKPYHISKTGIKEYSGCVY